ncbi:hypothetical protein PPERSA_02029 [Pseudocohnilembus persalinus]|uniref:Adenosine deaminase domain-containing protein n=1 Tax=Pseudocohnilembus persalinus TaxID=266149 RepID=A0A0V0QF60_PSEPJ|nr:hypothetical protein PPERSA_02029 [Pseudocohnilembus persalinus]|eukprot:KRX00850.1 hypothetical protein PPERSA_02029 [Pseudocohnilembus persalinus]
MNKQEFYEKREQLKNCQKNKIYDGLKFSQQEQVLNQKLKIIAENERKYFVEKFGSQFFMSNSAVYEKQIKNISLEKNQNNSLFQILLQVPKLFEEIVKQETTFIEKETGKFFYFQNQDQAGSMFLNLLLEREKSKDKQQFDREIRKKLVLSEDEAADKDKVWQYFQEKINNIINLKEGIDHVEIRAQINSIFSDKGVQLSFQESIEQFVEIQSEMRKKYEGFSITLNQVSLKFFTPEVMKKQLKETFQLKQLYPNLVEGYDMVQEEDKAKSVLDFYEIFQEKDRLAQEFGFDLNLYMHGGESLLLKNENIIDLIQLNCKRIGHGINLVQHSYLMETVREKDICLEICPLSNQILGYCYDLRNHPARTFQNFGIKLCINPDDHGIFNYQGVTLDFYMCMVAFEFDLRDLKLCCLNSLKYSSLQEKEKQEKIISWSQKWDKWVNQVSLEI